MTVEEILSGFIPDESATNTISFGGGLAFDNIKRPDQAEVSSNFNPLAMVPARHRRSDTERYLAFAKDAFDYVSGLDPKGFLGKTEQMMNDYDKMRMEEDPEGYQTDMNRAKALSQRAYATNDPELKKKYGAAIKQLLPRETQGMDDLTASEFLVGNEKLELEKLKAANRLAVQALKNQGGLDTAGLKADSAERIASMKAENALEIKMLDGEMKQALKDKDFEKAAMIQDKIMERTIAGKEMDFDREVMKQGAATERTNIQQGGANYRANLAADTALKKVEMQQKGALERAQIMQNGALERAKITAAAKAKGNTPEKATALQMKVAPDRLRQMKQLNDSAGRWETNMYDPNDPSQTWWTRQNIISRKGKDYGISRSDNDKEAQSYQQFEGMAKQIVQDQLRQIYGSQFTEKEGERFFQSMGLSPLTDKKVRWSLFMEAINDLRVKNGYAAIDPETFEEVGGSIPTQQTQSNNVIRTGGRRVF